jgi:hypothetical protein
MIIKDFKERDGEMTTCIQAVLDQGQLWALANTVMGL